MVTVLPAPRLEGKFVAAVRLWNVTYVAGPVGFTIPSFLPLAGSAALLALAIFALHQCVMPPAATAATLDLSPQNICGALLPLGISTGEWTQETTEQGRYACLPSASGLDRGRVSLSVRSSPADPTLVGEILLEGKYNAGPDGTTIANQMVWASSSIFSLLGMEVPWQVLAAIHDRGHTEAGASQLRVSVDHQCNAASSGKGLSCRSSIRIPNAATAL